MSHERLIGLDIGGTTTAAVLGDRAGNVLDRAEFETEPERGFDAVFDDMCAHVEQICAKADDVAALSVSVGGPLDIARGILYSPPNLPGWDAVPLKDKLAERFGLPVHVEHDGNAGALAEWYFGAARGARNAVFLTMGTGLGAGLILNGDLYRGTTDMAGEVGHIRIAGGGPESYGKAGSWEAFCSGAGIPMLAALLFPGRWTHKLPAVEMLADAASDGHGPAGAVFRECARRLGEGLALLVDILNPEIIVIGSLAVRLGDLVLAPARDIVQREALPRAVEACRIVPAELGERLGDVASLCAAIRALGGPTEATGAPSPPPAH